MKLILIGTGYIGLPGGAVFAKWGHDVVCVDIDEKKINMIKKGEMPIYEPGLEELVAEGVASKRLSFSTSLKRSIKGADVIFICVGTPQGDDGSADLKYVFAAAEQIGKCIQGYAVVVVKSTVPVGTNEKVKKIVQSVIDTRVKKGEKKISFDVVSNPEFLREGYAVDDMVNTDRTIIGYDSEKALKIMTDLYGHLEAPLVACSIRSAEAIKYSSNAFLATKISFINEIAQFCERSGADIKDVAMGMGYDKRIGSHFLYPGIGYGGSCFPKDVKALAAMAQEALMNLSMVAAVQIVNESQREYFHRKIIRYFGENLSGKTVACLGIAFKENTDDTRESVSVKEIKALRGAGAKIRTYDPQALETGRNAMGEENITYCRDVYDAIKGSHFVVILTEWDEFRQLDLKKVKKLLPNPGIVFDGRNLWDPQKAEAEGFIYFAVGRQTNGLALLDEDHKRSYAILENGSNNKK